MQILIFYNIGDNSKKIYLTWQNWPKNTLQYHVQVLNRKDCLVSQDRYAVI